LQSKSKVHREKIEEIGYTILKHYTCFATKNRITEWLPWINMLLTDGIQKRPTDKMIMDIDKSVNVDIASNGLLCKSQFNTLFSSCIANRSVSKGNWYWEVELRSSGLYQIGYVNEKFVANPEEGAGVGDDENSWAVDLYRQKKWHKYNDNITSVRFGEDIENWEKGGILQCWISLDTSKVMTFGYNGKVIGPAFENFDIGQGLYPAFSANRRNGCLFNFGDTPFKFCPEIIFANTPPETHVIYHPICNAFVNKL